LNKQIKKVLTKFNKKDRISHIGPEEFVHFLMNEENKMSKGIDHKVSFNRLDKKNTASRSASNLQAYIFWHNRYNKIILVIQIFKVNL
jgi:hypothetical protein